MIFRRRPRKLIFASLPILGLIIFAFQNCMVQQPSVDRSLASTVFSHKGTEAECSSCHEGERPKSNVGFANLNPLTPFDYGTHGSGLDCITCHSQTTVGVRDRGGWADGYFAHQSTLTNCIGCHLTERPTAPVGPNAFTSTAFDHSRDGKGDCFGCHTASMSSSFASMADWQGGGSKPAELVWDESQDLNLNSQFPSWVNTSIVSFAPSAVPAVMHFPMNHYTTQVTPENLGNCYACHSTGSYMGGVFHASLTRAGWPQPKVCSDCHTPNHRPVGFIGNVDQARSPKSPAMHHDAVVWSKSAAGNYVPTSMGIVSNDCAVCHTPPAVPVTSGSGFQNAKFHASLATNNLGQPSSCLDCHANSRFVGLAMGTLTAFDHASIPQGMGDCITCHNKPGQTWSGGVFHQIAINATLTNCNSCHNSQRPTNATFKTSNGVVSNFVGYDAVKLPFDLDTHGGARDCTQCHKPNQYIAAANWSGGNFDHVAARAAGQLSSCVDCHSSQRPAGLVGPNAYTATAFNHAINGQGDCIACHSATVTAGTYSNFKTNNAVTWGDTDWKGGVTYSATGLMGPDPAAPKTTIASIALNSSVISLPNIVASSAPQVLLDQMYHSSNQVPAAFWQGNVVGSTLKTTCNGANDKCCSTCHSGLSLNPPRYLPGKFHANVPAASLTSCKDCHVNTAPKNIVGPAPITNGMNHFAAFSDNTTAYSSFDCATCHVAASAGTTFGGATFHSKIGNKTPANCTACHYSTATSTAIYPLTPTVPFTAGMHHKAGSVQGECSVCHVLSSAQIVAAPKTTASWRGGTFHKNTMPATITTCVECHTTKPALTVSSYDGQHMNHGSAMLPSDCVSCHRSELVPGATPTVWLKTAVFHNVVANPSTCKECHGLTNGGGSTIGTNNDLPVGLSNSSTRTTSSVAPANTFDQISHATSEVTTHDCNYCHTVAGMTAGGAVKWNSGLFHSKYSSNASISSNCVACHTNVKPSVVVGGFDHNSIGAQDCKACHIYPGTGKVGGTGTAAPNWKGAGGAVPARVAYVPPSGKNWGNLTTAHPSTTSRAGMTCATCHVNYNSVASIKGFDHNAMPSGTKCVYCHYTGQQAVASGIVKTKSHEGASNTKDCSSSGCHTNGSSGRGSFPTWNSTTKTFTGGKWD